MIIRKPILLFFVFLSTFISCKKEIEENTFKDAEYFITKKAYEHNEDEKNLVRIEKNYFNKNNQVIQVSSFHKAYQFEVSGKNKYYYNNQLQLIKFEAYSKFYPGNLQKIYDTIYDYENGLVKTKTIHNALGKVDKIVDFLYSGDTLIKEFVKFITYSPYNYWHIYEYDNLGRLSVKKMYNDLGLRQTYRYTYTGNKLTTEVLEMGIAKDIFEYSYDGDLLIKIEKFEQTGTAQRALFARDQFFYDQNGRLKKKVSSNGRVSFDPPVFTYVYIYEY